MSAEVPARAAAGSAMASWSAKALLITAGVFLVGGAIWYARAATVPLIVAALVSTQLLPLIGWATRRGVSRGLAIAASLIGVVLVTAGLAWLFADALFGNLGGVGEDISEGADEVVTWLRDNNDWVEQHEDAIRELPQGHSAGRQGRRRRRVDRPARRSLVRRAAGQRRAADVRLPALHPHRRRRDLGLDPGALQRRPPRPREPSLAPPPGTPRAATSAASRSSR